MGKSVEQITGQILKVINKTIFLEKRRIVQLDDDALYPSEIHLMLVIKDQITSNISEIARQMHVTKGAVSQTVGRLEKKGLVRKERDTSKKNELILSLTPKGRKAYRLCLASKHSFENAFKEYLTELNDVERELIYSFLEHMASTFDEES